MFLIHMFLIHSQRMDSIKMALQADAARIRAAMADLEGKVAVESKTRERKTQRSRPSA